MGTGLDDSAEAADTGSGLNNEPGKAPIRGGIALPRRQAPILLDRRSNPCQTTPTRPDSEKQTSGQQRDGALQGQSGLAASVPRPVSEPDPSGIAGLKPHRIQGIARQAQSLCTGFSTSTVHNPVRMDERATPALIEPATLSGHRPAARRR